MVKEAKRNGKGTQDQSLSTQHVPLRSQNEGTQRVEVTRSSGN